MLNWTWYGNATVKIDDGSHSVLFDPFFTRNPALPPLTLDDIRPCSAIAITHGHFDHAGDLPKIAADYDGPIFVPLETFANLCRLLHPYEGKLRPVTPGDKTALGALMLTPYAAEHIVIDKPLIATTLAKAFGRNQRAYLNRLPSLLKENVQFPVGRCLGWMIERENLRVINFGSLAIDPKETYPADLNVASLPFQGNSKIEEKALEVVEALKPKKVLLHHYDDAFPPISSSVPTDRFAALMAERWPNVPVVVGAYRQPVVIV
ncbi:MAG: MBL fold metallo-hydrolase [Myxococcales bacterium]|nr:MAG: MBL fold metallo-hydrolase [Myxococcales bacterium]